LSRSLKLLVPAVAVALGVCLAASACGSSSATDRTSSSTSPSAKPSAYTVNFTTAEGTPKDGGVLSFGLEAESDSLSPVTGTWALSGHMEGSAIYDPLATTDAHGQTVPYLAQSFGRSADNRTWTITMRPNVLFQDGEKCDAVAVALNLNTYRKALITGKALAPITSVKVTGPLTVQVTVDQPWATFPNVFLSQGGYIVAPKTLADPHGGEHPIGTGPFMFKEWKVNDHLTVVKNPHYWQKGLPHLDQIIFRPIPDSGDRLAALQDGTVDAVDMVTPQQVTTIRQDASLHRLEYGRGEELFVPLNTQKAPFDNLHARLALAYATNQAELVKQLGPGVYTPANGMFAPDQLGYTTDSGYPTYDLAKAKQEVAAYTAQTGQPLSFAMTATPEVAYAQQDQLLADMWAAAGAHVTLRQIDQADQAVAVVVGDYQAADFRLFGQPDPDADAYWWAGTSVGAKGDVSLNMPRYATTKTDADLAAGRATTDPAARNTAYQAFERDLNAGIPYVWLVRTDWVLASTARVHGYVPAGNGTIATLGPKTWIADLWLS
jgi:peptide/nickel transport system substrate-binding protein